MVSSSLKELRLCPVCDQALDNHVYSFLASAALKPDHEIEVQRFLDDIENHNWHTVMESQEWLGATDNFELYGIRSPNHGMVLGIVRDPFELFENSHVVGIERITLSDETTIMELAQNREWSKFD
jgi:hypothetical protein